MRKNIITESLRITTIEFNSGKLQLCKFPNQKVHNQIKINNKISFIYQKGW